MNVSVIVQVKAVTGECVCLSVIVQVIGVYTVPARQTSLELHRSLPVYITAIHGRVRLAIIVPCSDPESAEQSARGNSTGTKSALDPNCIPYTLY